MKLVWEIEDIKAGTKIKKPMGNGRFLNYIIAYHAEGVRLHDKGWGIFHVEEGEFITVGSGSVEALVQHLNNCGFKPMDVE